MTGSRVELAARETERPRLDICMLHKTRVCMLARGRQCSAEAAVTYYCALHLPRVCLHAADSALDVHCLPAGWVLRALLLSLLLLVGSCASCAALVLAPTWPGLTLPLGCQAQAGEPCCGQYCIAKHTHAYSQAVHHGEAVTRNIGM